MNEIISVHRDTRVVVVSDVHIGAGEIDDFKPELENHFVRFLDQLAVSPQPLELIINGDCFDFATASPFDDPQLESRTAWQAPLCFTEAQSCRKLQNMVESHGQVFDALARLLAQPSHSMTILPGNHDADLFWRDVRSNLLRAIEERGGTSERVRFVLERACVVERSGKRHWIEHGHQHDPINSFFVGGQERWSFSAPPILMDAMGHERLYECPGTLGLVRYINGWRKCYQSIGYIKPNSRILMALATHKCFNEPGRPLLVAWQLANLLGLDVDWKTALDEGDDVHRHCQGLLAELAENLNDEEQLAFVAWLSEHGVKLGSTLKTSIEMPFECNRILTGVASSLGAQSTSPPVQLDDHTLGFAAGSFKDIENQALVAMASRLMKSDLTDYVITGHTHVPVTVLDGRLINGGCWVPNQEVDSVSAAEQIIFQHGSVPYRLSYVDIPVDMAPRLETFAEGKLWL